MIIKVFWGFLIDHWLILTLSLFLLKFDEGDSNCFTFKKFPSLTGKIGKNNEFSEIFLMSRKASHKVIRYFNFKLLHEQTYATPQKLIKYVIWLKLLQKNILSSFYCVFVANVLFDGLRATESIFLIKKCIKCIRDAEYKWELYPKYFN